MGEEADILRDMVSDRDKRIEKIKRKSEEQRGKELVLSEQLERVAAEVRTQTAVQEKEKAELVQGYRKIAAKLEAMQRDFTQQGASLRKYCVPVRDELNNDPSYVMRMQAQLCKAMHSMGINDHQLEVVEKHADALIKYYKDQITLETDEKTKRELTLMNELMGLDTEKRDLETEFTEKLDAIFKECEALERQIKGNRDSDEESDEEEDETEEEDEEEKEAKEELMNLLTERRTEIERLEQEQEEKEELIAEMEEQLQDAQAAAAEAAERRKLDVEVKAADSGDEEDGDEDDEPPVEEDATSSKVEETDGTPPETDAPDSEFFDASEESEEQPEGPEESSTNGLTGDVEQEKKDVSSDATDDDENSVEDQ